MNCFGKKEKKKILFLGLDYAGKSEFLRKYCQIIDDKSNIGYRSTVSMYRNYQLVTWDISPNNIRPLYGAFYADTKGVMIVLDGSDRNETRINFLARELELLLQEKELKNVPLVVFINKTDLPDCMTEDEVIQVLKLTTLPTTKWFIYSGSIKNNTGIEEAFSIFEDLYH